MKRYLLVILMLLIPSLALGQNGGWQVAPGVNTPRALNTPGTPMNRANVDIYGSQMVVPGPNASPFPYQQSLSEATPAPMVVFQATAVPTTVPTPQFVNTSAMKHSFVTNTTNQDVYVHLNGSVTPAAIVPSGSTWFRNWGSTGSKMSGSIAVTRPGTLPTTGSIAIGGDS